MSQTGDDSIFAYAHALWADCASSIQIQFYDRMRSCEGLHGFARPSEGLGGPRVPGPGPGGGGQPPWRSRCGLEGVQ